MTTSRNLLVVQFAPRRPGEWMPPSGTSGIENVAPMKSGSPWAIVCQHGAAHVPFDLSLTARTAFFAQAHPSCPLRWVRLLWSPPAAAIRTALGVTGTPDAATQRALARVRRRGEIIGAWLAANGCNQCEPSLEEVGPSNGDPKPVGLRLIHSSWCQVKEAAQ